MFRINHQSPEWLAIKEVLEKEKEEAIKFLLKPGLPAHEYDQWRGRVLLADKLLSRESGTVAVTD